MSVVFGLSVGEAFAELVSATMPPQRWYLARRPLLEGLREALAAVAAEGGEIRIATQMTSSLSRRLGYTPAVLVSTGFETWLELQTPVQKTGARRHPQRIPAYLKGDHIFGISERIAADGTVELAPTMDDLQFLAAKLELLKTRTIAVALLHAGANPAHEILIRDFFRERGFRVFCSHEFTAEAQSEEAADELERWNFAAASAYASASLLEQRAQVLEALPEEHRERWQIRFLSSSGTFAKADAEPNYASTFGLAEGLWQRAGFLSASPPAAALHLGLERFLLLLPGRARAHANDPGAPRPVCANHRQLAIGPVSPIAVGAWGIPVFTESTRGFEPGPMAFGKALQPTVFDVLWALERLKPIDSVSNLFMDRAPSRVLEALYTLSKDIPSSGRVDPKTVAQDLELVLLEGINRELIAAGFGSGQLEGEILVSGALGASLLPRLKERRPDLPWRLAPDAEWAETRATLDFSDLIVSGEPPPRKKSERKKEGAKK